MTTPITHDMVLTHIFEAPVESVWRAWTEAEPFMRWWGPTGFTSPVAEMDVRHGGQSLVCMRAPAEFGGGDTFHTWTYTTVIPTKRLDFVQTFTDAKRNPVEPADLGLPAGIPRDVPHVVTFRALDDGRTELTVTESGYTAPEIVELSRGGMAQCLDKLALVVENRAPTGSARV
jgi:uncharacterized protein YndB with AHSA1/START domain